MVCVAVHYETAHGYQRKTETPSVQLSLKTESHDHHQRHDTPG